MGIDILLRAISHFAKLCFGVASIIDVSHRIHTVKIMLQVLIQKTSPLTCAMGLSGQNQFSTSCQNLDSSRLEPLSPTTYSAHTVQYSQTFPKSINVSFISPCRWCTLTYEFLRKLSKFFEMILIVSLLHSSFLSKEAASATRRYTNRRKRNQHALIVCGSEVGTRPPLHPPLPTCDKKRAWVHYSCPPPFIVHKQANL